MTAAVFNNSHNFPRETLATKMEKMRQNSSLNLTETGTERKKTKRGKSELFPMTHS